MAEKKGGSAKPKSLAEAKVAVMSEVGYCLKTTSQGLNYTYASEAELIAALRPVLITHGITVAPVETKVAEVVRYETKRGTPMFVTRILVTYRFTHADSDTHEDVVVLGEGGDVGDKSGPKAMTCAFKYALRQAFMIETGDDPDRFASQPAVSKVEQERQVEMARQAINQAETLEMLDKYRTVYTEERDFEPHQVAALDGAYSERLAEMSELTQETEEQGDEG